MSRIIRAIVTTNSCDDKYARVKIKCDNLLNETPLIESVSGIPLKKNDVVFVDVTDGYDSALIIGRSFDKITTYSKLINGSLLFESSNGKEWTIAFVKNDDIEIYNSSNASIIMKGNTIVINSSSVTIKGGNLQVEGKTSPTGKGGFCGIPVCPFTGATHIGDVISGT